MRRMLLWMMVVTGCLIPVAGKDFVEVPGEHLEAYFGGSPERYLVDPQGLLKPGERRERERFLEYHAADSEVDFHVLLFGEGQSIPEGVRVEELAERFFGGERPALLALYFLGEPERVKVWLSPRIAEVVGPVEFDRLRGQAVRAAASRVVAAEQLEDFCVQMAIGIFWIEREAGLGEGPETAGPARESELETGARQASGERLRGRIAGWWAEWGVPASVVIGTILAAAILRVVVRRRARYRFPEALPEPRLGGRHGAAVGALVEFRTSTRSPSSQKGRSDDPLGGL